MGYKFFSWLGDFVSPLGFCSMFFFAVIVALESPGDDLIAKRMVVDSHQVSKIWVVRSLIYLILAIYLRYDSSIETENPCHHSSKLFGYLLTRSVLLSYSIFFSSNGIQPLKLII